MWFTRKLGLFSALFFMFAGCAAAAEPTAKPAVTVAADGFPTGTDTPEGAACDLARAFIHDDSALLLATCIEPFGGPEARAAYHDFLKGIVVQMKTADAGDTPMPESPKSIARCFAARHLGKDGPASYGYAVFGFQDVMFVDVSATLHNGDTQLCRTLVIKGQTGQVDRVSTADASPLLSAGLDDEPPSTRDFSEVYSVPPGPTTHP